MAGVWWLCMSIQNTSVGPVVAHDLDIQWRVSWSFRRAHTPHQQKLSWLLLSRPCKRNNSGAASQVRKIACKNMPTKTAKPASCSLQSSLGTDRTLPSLPFASVWLPRSLASRAPGANDVGAAIGAWRLHVGAMVWKRADSPEDFWNGNFWKSSSAMPWWIVLSDNVVLGCFGHIIMSCMMLVESQWISWGYYYEH